MQALESLILNTTGVDYEIIVVDNASQDDSIEMVRSIFPAVKVLALGENCGYAKANNRGVEKSTGRYLLFLNNDTHVPEGAVRTLLEIKKNHPEFGMVAPLILYPDKSPQLSWGRDIHFVSEVFLKFFAEKWYAKQIKRKKGEISRNVDWVSGACFLIERSLYKQVGGFDEKFFLYFEDADLGKRIRQLGKKIHLTSNARIVHYLGQTVRKMQGLALLEAKRSQLYYYCKHNSRWAFAGIRGYLLLRFGLKRWWSRKSDSESAKICIAVIDMIREFRCENPV
jgi:GT2 family glycosyltransferase